MNTSTAPSIEHVSPDALTIEDNVREALDLPKPFVASIKQHGVLQPVLAHRNSDGTLYVRDGQRRTLAAREAGIATMPAYIVTANDETKTRIVQQIVTNEQRDALSDRDRVRGFASLALEGLSAHQIARATGTKRATVEQAVTIAQDETASNALEAHSLNLEEAAALAEFADDPDAQAAVLEVVEAGSDATWTIKRIRDQRERETTVAKAAAELTAQGTRVLSDEEADQAERLHNLTDAAEDAEQRPGIDEAAHTTCPGHGMHVTTDYRGEAHTLPMCAEPAQHHTRWGQTQPQQSGPMTDEQKDERRKVIANNKAWREAEPIRHEWISTFLSRKTLPKDAQPYAATVLASRASLISYKELDAAAQFTGQDARFEAIEGKPGHTFLALAVAAIEATTGVHTWRDAREGGVSNYFRQIAAWGYPLTAVEKIAACITED